VDAVVNLCPVYERPSRKPAYLKDVREVGNLPPTQNFGPTLLKLIGSPDIADKEWVFRQYDHMVQTNTVLLPGADAAVLRVKGLKKALAMTVDGNALYCYLDPRRGGMIAVAEACRNLACVGARPVGVTNCLNFGNPEKPEIMWQFKEVVEGMAEACRAFEIPVTGGNVSFYNDTEGVSIHPTPVLGIVGLIDDVDRVAGPGFKKEGDAVVLLGENRAGLGGSAYLRTIHGLERGRPPAIHLDRERAVQEACIEAITRGLVRSAHDLSEGGLALGAAESCLLGGAGIGCVLDLDDQIRPDELLFGEAQSRILVSVSDASLPEFLGLASEMGAPAKVIGRAQGRELVIRMSGREVVRVPLHDLLAAWKNALPGALTAR
jgi:phosphoribosylformylglycinamidine synthase